MLNIKALFFLLLASEFLARSFFMACLCISILHFTLLHMYLWKQQEEWQHDGSSSARCLQGKHHHLSLIWAGLTRRLKLQIELVKSPGISCSVHTRNRIEIPGLLAQLCDGAGVHIISLSLWKAVTGHGTTVTRASDVWLQRLRL